MEKHHPVFHLFLPTTLKSNNVLQKLTTSEECKLIGIWERHPPPISIESLNLPTSIASQANIISSTINTVTVTIFGLHFDGHQEDVWMRKRDFTLDGNPKFKIIGEVSRTETISRFSSGSIELPPLWITLRVNKTNVMIEQICLDNLMLLPEPENIVMVEYNPSWLKYCVNLETISIHSIVIEAYQLGSIFSCNDDTIRLLPNSEEPERENIENNGTEKTKKQIHKTKQKDNLTSRIINRSLGLQQLQQKLLMIIELSTTAKKIPFLNLLCMLMIDTFLGILLTMYLLQFPHLFPILHMKIDTVVNLLQQLLQWLRGSPAGFKLNSALNSLLWRFFSYHLHLWGNYIGILQPFLSFILTLVIQVGVLGLTVQVALIKDLLSITTFHIYCLYIYATRLFAIQLRALKSLGRLFYGRKWNPLRNRVDSIQLSTSEMFVSSLIFTIAIFLAPTTIIYYAVFLSLRLPVLITEAVLSYIVKTMNSLKIATSFLILLNSPRVANEIYLEPVTRNGFLTFEIRIQTKRRIFELPNILRMIGKTVQHILQGKLLILTS